MQISDLAQKIIDLGTDKAMMVAPAESCTGGLIAASLTDISGSSAVLDRGFVTYSNEAKMQMLGVTAESLSRFGAVSAAVAKEMAFGALAHSRADISLSVTGVAGPSGGSADKPVGLVWFATCIQGEGPVAIEKHFGAELNRAAVRARAQETGLSLMLAALQRA